MYNNQDMSIRFQGRRDCVVVLRACLLHKVRVNMALWLGFSDGSAGKQSTCNAGDPGSIPGSGRSTGEGIAYPLQYSWASLVAQLVKTPPAMWKTWIGKIPWRRERLPHSSVLTWRIPWTVYPWGCKELDRTE